MKVLVIEDDRTVGQHVKRGLEEHHCQADLVDDGLEGLRLASGGRYDLIVLDLRLPSMNGIEMLHTLRDRGITTPILVLTAQDAVDFKVEALRAGADDYVTKPFRLAELLARVRAHLRRPRSAEPDGRVIVGDVEVDRDARRAWVGGRELDLRAKEFDLLTFLVEEAGSAVTRERIMTAVWDEHWFGSTKTLDMHVSALRRKLDDATTEPSHITTLRGVGYRFELS
jgi:DNA-binding response OmpR family regulator